MDDKKTIIYTTARELFSRNGFADTNVAEIAKTAGMAVGTFYLYYPSKEQLFMEIFLEENAKLKTNCLEALDLSLAPFEIVKQMLAMNLAGMSANPIYRNGTTRPSSTRSK